LTLETSFGKPIPETFLRSYEQPLSRKRAGRTAAAIRRGRQLRGASEDMA